MLRALSIRDYVIVERLDLELAAGFTALTGETGAGKSILVDALSLALGGRAEAGVVRPGAERAEVCAEFDIARNPGALAWLESQALDEGEACILRRTIDASGRSRAFVNGRAATAAQLREVGESLVDIHGQHDHQLLLRRDHQRLLLDAYAGAEDLAREVAERHAAWRRLAAQRRALEEGRESAARERQFLAHEVRELEALAFDPRQWGEEQAEHRRLGHAQELIETVAACAEGLDESEASATAVLAHAAAQLESAAGLDPALEEVRAEVEAANLHAAEAAQQLRRYLQRLDVDPERLAALDRRLKAVLDCARKMRIDPGEIPGALEQRRERLAALGGEESLEALGEQERAAERAYRECGAKLGEARRGAAGKLGAEVTRTMQKLAMQGGRLSVVLQPLEEPSAAGLESVELHVSTHPGQPLAPLAKVASGGELSRVCLALQMLLSGRASVPTLIFDEVDSGIGGAVAEIVGELLETLSRKHQVLSVTHLAQVAVHAREQLRVSKEAGARGTFARVEPLDAEERLLEVARMLGGVRITEATRRHAGEMLQNARARRTRKEKAI